jgi:transposase
MDKHNIESVSFEDESYEESAMRAHLRGELSFKDLRASLGYCRSHTYRLIHDYEKCGLEAFQSKKHNIKNYSYSDEFKKNILEIVKEYYPDFGPKFASEKLEKLNDIKISRETMRIWMHEEGLHASRRNKTAKKYSSRAPRDSRGELIQVDGSYHRWFEKRGPETCLLVFIDDATSELMYMRFVHHESSFNYMLCLKSYIELYGRPWALYADKYSVFRSANLNSKDERPLTRFAKACTKLEIKVICASAPQSKGRVERSNRTLQDRLIKEMRLRNISTMEEANAYLPIYIAEHNAQFARVAANPFDAHIPAPNLDLSTLLTYTVQRRVFKDLSVNFNKSRYILNDSEEARKAIGKQITVVVYLDGTLEIMLDETSLPYRCFDKLRLLSETQVVDHKRLGAALAVAQTISEVEPHHFKRNNDIPSGFRDFFAQPIDPTSIALLPCPRST